MTGTLGERMKAYEADALQNDRSKDSITVIRLDGNSFHTWIRKARIKRPFSEIMVSAMQETAKSLCLEIPDCVMAYTQSDEISLVLKRGESTESGIWFDNRIQKLCSISASMASAYFNREIGRSIESCPLAFFDARVIFFPCLEEVVNCLIWRQNDCMKNSVATLAQSMFSPAELLKKRQDEQIAMMLERGVDWHACPNHLKLGSLIHKRKQPGEYNGVKYFRSVFYVDMDVPQFSENKQYLMDAYYFKINPEE